MATQTPVVGKIVWHDLVTHNMQKSMKFYKELLGWDYTQMDMGPAGTYNMIHVGDKDIGGFMEPADEKAPNHWAAYVSVDDVDRSAQTIKSHGGQLALEPRDIPDVGRFAVGVDPEGATICVFQGTEQPSDDVPRPQIREFCWDELVAANPEAAASYYSDLFNWSFQKGEMGEAGPYWTAMRGEHMAAGIMKNPDDSKAPPHWQTYVYVEDLDSTVAMVKPLGGRILLQPMTIPAGRVAVIEDNLGAVLGLFSEPVNA